MRSPTQPRLSEAGIAAIVTAGLGAAITGASELTGGTYAAVWRAGLADGRQVVVKVGPPASARLLEYEQGLIQAEAEYFSMVRAQAPGVPVPEVLAVSTAPAWIITSLLPGTPLADADSPRARTELGAAVARVHTITGPHSGPRPATGPPPSPR
jgi:tRNA A-37 threonylcarbamoyl transferase component Bud32